MHKGKVVLLIILTVLISGTLIATAFAVDLGPVMNTQRNGRFIQIRCDNDGDIHLCYFRDYNLYYYYQNNGTWQTERLVRGTDSNTVNSWEYPAFDIDNNEHAHFAWGWQPTQHTQIWYTEFNPFTSSFSNPVVVIQDNYGDPDVRRPSLTACPNGRIYVATESDFSIEWDWKESGGSWQNPATAIQGFSYPQEPVFPTLTCGSNNQPICLFSHFNQTYLDLGISQYNNSWPSPIPPTQNWLGGITHSTDVTLDTLNRPHISWLEWRDGTDFDRVGYNSRNGSSHGAAWNQEVYVYIQSGMCTAEPCPIPRVVLNSQDDICIVFGRYTGGTADVRYIFKESGTSWPNPYDLPPKINDTARQGYPGVCVDPTTDDIIIAWEENPQYSNIGKVYYRRLRALPPALSPPTLDNVSYYEGKIYINWMAPLDPYGIMDYYELQRLVDQGLWMNILNTKSNYYIDEDVWGGSEFSYKVRAVDIYGRESRFSSVLSVFIEPVPSLSFWGYIVLVLLTSFVMLKAVNNKKKQAIEM